MHARTHTFIKRRGGAQRGPPRVKRLAFGGHSSRFFKPRVACSNQSPGARLKRKTQTRASLPTTAGYLPRADAARPRRLCTTTSRPERRELPPKTAQRTRDDPDWRSPARPSSSPTPPPLTPRGGTTRCYYRFPFMSERSLHDLRTTWRRPVGGGARLRAHGGQRVLPSPRPDQGDGDPHRQRLQGGPARQYRGRAPFRRAMPFLPTRGHGGVTIIPELAATRRR